jgi:hypothetical protein
MVIRRAFVFVSLLGMLGATAAMGHARVATQRSTETPTADLGSVAPTSEPALDATSSPDENAQGSERGLVRAPFVGPDPAPIRVVSLGWEVLAPGILANDGRTPGPASHFGEVGLTVRFDAVTDIAEIQRRLGRGGHDDEGADVALIPYPEFVASYERLRALSPQVFFVVAWSRGRDALLTERPDALSRPTKGEVVLEGRPGQAATLLGLFALDEAGVSLDRVRLRDPGEHSGAAPKGALALSALERSTSAAPGTIDARKLVLSTAEATHLVPVVAIAPAGHLERRHAAMVAWSQGWLHGVDMVHADPTSAARRIAEDEGTPEVVDLIDALGWLSFASVSDNARMSGLAGRGALNLDVLFHRTWDLWRSVGVLTTPAPEATPLWPEIMAEVAVLDHGRHEVARERAGGLHRDAGAPLLVRPSGSPVEDAELEARLQAHAALLAAIFSRSEIRLAVARNPRLAKRIVDRARDRHGLAEDRLSTERRPRASAGATLTVMPVR